LTVEQEEFLTVRSLATGYISGFVIEAHTHPWHQLLFASRGAMTVRAGRYSWMVPPGRAVLIPAGCTHTIRMWGNVAMRSLYVAPALCHFAGECEVLAVTPLLRELILRVIELAALDSRVATHQRLLGTLMDEIDDQMRGRPGTPLMVPLPSERRALRLAHHVLDNPPGSESLDSLARQYGMGRRTAERLFQEETGISLGLLRQKVRMLDSIRVIAEEKSVTETALETGYSSVSAFIAAFKRTFGFTPGKIA
jgi:AraC-like DNA-binding protein